MAEPILYVDRSTVHDGKLAELETAMGELVDFVEANAPDIRSYEVYFDAGGDRMTVVHTHDDPASLEFHMEVAGPKFPPIGRFIELESIDMLGDPGAELVHRLREKASELGTVSIHEHHAGFARAATD